MDPYQANLQPNLLLFGSHLCFNPTPTFLGVTFNHTLSFSKCASLLKAKFLPCLKALHCVSASSWDASKESFSVLYKSFLQPFLTYTSRGWFPFPSVPISPNWNASTKQLVAPSSAASRFTVSHFFSSRLFHLPESP